MANLTNQPTDKFRSAEKPIRQSVTIEQLIDEELNIEEPLEELLAMVTP